MGIPDGAHTHGHGGSGLPEAVVVLIVAVLAVRILPAVLGAVAELVRLVLITAAVIGGLVAVGLVAFIALRLRRGRQDTPLVVYRVTPAPPRPPTALPAPQPPVLEQRAVHLYFHGVDAADVAAIIRQREDQ